MTKTKLLTVQELRASLKVLGFRPLCLTREHKFGNRELRYATLSYKLPEDGRYMSKTERDSLTGRLFTELRLISFDKPHDWSFEKDVLLVQAYVDTQAVTKG